jgi:hypothetical protein
MLRRIYGLKRDEVTGDWRRLHNEELHNLYSSTDIIRMIKLRRMRWVGRVARMGRGERPLRRPRRRWVDNIKIDLRRIEWVSVDWINLAQNRDQWRALVNTVMNLRVP